MGQGFSVPMMSFKEPILKCGGSRRVILHTSFWKLVPGPWKLITQRGHLQEPLHPLWRGSLVFCLVAGWNPCRKLQCTFVVSVERLVGSRDWQLETAPLSACTLACLAFTERSGLELFK